MPHRVLLALIAALALAGAACGSGKRPAPVVVAMAGQVVGISQLRTIAAGICDAARQAATNVDTARQTFFGQSHDGIHLIARGLQDKHRDASATLLEAKVKVEEDFVNPPAPAKLAADLRSLAAVTRNSLAIFDVTVDPCPR